LSASRHAARAPGDVLGDFAVGFSRQPLPNGRRFARFTHPVGTGIRATDATARRGPVRASLRPKPNRSHTAKLAPTAIFSFAPRDTVVGRSQSNAGSACVGHNKITNGVRQELFGTGLPGVELGREGAA